MRVRWLFFSLLIFLATGCTSVQVFNEYDSTFDLNKGNTFSFAENNQPVYNNEVLDRSFRSDITAQLESRGIYKTQYDPDILIRYETEVEQTRDFIGQQNNPFWGFPAYGFYGPTVFWPYGVSPFMWGPYNPGFYQNNTYETINKTGTLIVKMINTQTDEVIWRSTATGAVDNPQITRKTVTKSVEKIFNDFPVNPVSPESEENLVSD